MTVDQLAAKADLSRATVYNHFHGLEGVVAELVLPALDNSIAAFKILKNRPGFIAFDDILSVLIDLWKDNRESFLAACMNVLPLEGEVKKRHDEFIYLFESVLGSVRESAVFRIPDVSKTASLIFRTFPEVFRITGGMDDSDQIFRSCMRALVLNS